MNQLIPLPKKFDDMEASAGKQIEAFLKVNTPGDIALNFLIIALLPALCEEALFRGCMQRVLIQVLKSPWAGIVLTAVLFSAFHLQFRGFFPRMFLGLLLGALYWFSGSLWVSITAHFFINGFQLAAALYYPKLATENPQVPVFLLMSSLVLIIGLLYYIIHQSETRFASEYPPDPGIDEEGFPT
jgi:membrane protease YdiL (CAAX protease family)